MLHKTLTSYHNDEPYDDGDNHPDGPLWLLTPPELETIGEGVRLESVSGMTYTVGKDDIETDTRDGYLMYGIRGVKDD